MALHAVNRTLASGLNKIVHEIQYLPHGYKFWRELGQRQQLILDRWRKHLYNDLFPSHIKALLTTVILNEHGIAKNKELYTWLKDSVYHAKETELYRDWHKTKNVSSP